LKNEEDKRWLEKERGQRLEVHLPECNQALDLKAREALEAMLVEVQDSPGGDLKPANPELAAAAAWARQEAAALVLDPMKEEKDL
jgi:RES domain-containing protein